MTAVKDKENAVHVLFLGTGAAEQIPSIYCRCDFCSRVRQIGGKDQRTRSSLRIGERYQIDFGPDANWQMNRCGVDMFDVEHLLITHTHSDHFQFQEIVSKSHAVKTNGKPLQIHMSVPAKEYLESVLSTFDSQIEDEPDLEAFWKRFPVHGLEYFRSYQIGQLRVETIKGSHKAEGEEQFSLNYLIQLPDGRRLLYAVDTGYYLEETWAFLEGKRVDLLIMDCTFTAKRGDPHAFGHHTYLSYVESLMRMKEIGFITANTRIFGTHFNPHQALLHEELEALLRESGFLITVAYDGLAI